MRRPQLGRPHYLLAALVFLTFWVSPVLAALLVPPGLLAIKVYRRGQTVGFRRSRFWGVLGTTIAVWVGVPLALSLLPGAFGERGGGDCRSRHVFRGHIATGAPGWWTHRWVLRDGRARAKPAR